MPLTDTEIRNAKGGPNRRKLSDGGGLHLEISPVGIKTWKMAYRFGGKQKTISGGRYPDNMKLADARGWREKVKSDLRSGLDPARVALLEKREAEATKGTTFKDIAQDWFSKNKGLWKVRHAAWNQNRLELDAYPVLGTIPISQVGHADVLALIARFEKRGTIEIGRKTLGLVSRIMRYAKAHGHAATDPVPEALDAMKPKPKVRHFAKLAPSALPDFYKRLTASGHDEVTKLALRWTILTMVRTNETRFFRPEEIEGRDTNEPVWRISADRMKMDREHLVPLPRQAIPLLERIEQLARGRGSPWQFPQTLNLRKPISENCMLYCLYDLGYQGKATVHGFRGVASTLLNEQTDSEGRRRFDSDWIETQLAHERASDVRGAYNSAKYLTPRRSMLQWWADFLEDQERMGQLL